MPTENYNLIAKLAQEDVEVLRSKGQTYGNSWKRRGGVGAFMMLARKWDRIENMVQNQNWDIFSIADVLEDVADLRRYLLLVEAHMREEGVAGEPTAGYVNQDRY